MHKTRRLGLLDKVPLLNCITILTLVTTTALPVTQTQAQLHRSKKKDTVGVVCRLCGSVTVRRTRVYLQFAARQCASLTYYTDISHKKGEL